MQSKITKLSMKVEMLHQIIDSSSAATKFGVKVHLFFYIMTDSSKLSGPCVVKLFLYSTQLSTNFVLLTNVKMQTIVGILTIICMINTTSETLKARNSLYFISILVFVSSCNFQARLRLRCSSMH